jgi:hypothetical protein
MRMNARKLISVILLAGAAVLLAARAPTYAFPFTTVYIKRPGVYYHRRNCLALRRGAVAISVSNAKEMGFRPCVRCDPPKW